ncbi:MAG: hypothetical protein PHQ28_12340 [Mycobacterium sp.]|nr:hypothetical protein [Mycobacterium sp.]
MTATKNTLDVVVRAPFQVTRMGLSIAAAVTVSPCQAESPSTGTGTRGRTASTHLADTDAPVEQAADGHVQPEQSAKPQRSRRRFPLSDRRSALSARGRGSIRRCHS